MLSAASSMWSQTSSITLASRYMSSRSKGVTNVWLRRLITACVNRSPSCSSSRMSSNLPRVSGHESSSSTSVRAISRAFAEAWVKSRKNSRFWGVRRSAIGCALVRRAGPPGHAEERIRHALDEPHQERDHGPPDADDDEGTNGCDHGRREDVARVVLADDHTPDGDQDSEYEKHGPSEWIDQEHRERDRECRGRVIARQRRICLVRPPDVRRRMSD